jgi:Protein kinase domain
MMQPTQHLSNPYNNTGPIKDPQIFINRDRLVAKLLSELFSISAQCLSIVGQRKSGKTSLVEHLSRSTTYEAFGYTGDDHLFVYIPCGQIGKALDSREDFYRLLLERLYAEVTRRLPNFLPNENVHNLQPYSWQEEWQTVLSKLADEHFRVVVTLDSFEELIQQQLIEDRLFGSLCASLAYNFVWITCSLQPLDILFEEAFEEFDISKTRRITESEFCGRFIQSYALHLFSIDDVEVLIDKPSSLHGMTFSPQEREIILRFGGRFPYFIQRACYHFFEAHREGAVNSEDILEKCLKDALRLWPKYWKRLSKVQRVILYSIASEHPVESSKEIEHLKEASLVYEEYGQLQPFSKEFGRFIREQKHGQLNLPVNPDERLWEKYDVVAIVGRTHHSQVVKAKDSLDRYFAIKLPCVNQEVTDQQLQHIDNLLQREAQLLARLEHLEHPYISKVHEINYEPLGMVMPWIEGISLDKIMLEKRPLQQRDVIKIGMQLADILRYVHEQGVRDFRKLN